MSLGSSYVSSYSYGYYSMSGHGVHHHSSTYRHGVYNQAYSPRVYQPYTYTQLAGQKTHQVSAVPVAFKFRTAVAKSPSAKAAPLAFKINTADAKSPSANAALSYLQNVVGGDSCGQLAKVYLEKVSSGGSSAQASADAQAVYIRNYNVRQRSAPGSPCAASEIAFKQAYFNGQDPVLAAALAYMNSYASDSPCFVAAKGYVEAVVGGSAHDNANLIAAKAFTRQIQALSAQGKATIDPVCAASAQSYASSSEDPSSPIAAAMQAFISKALQTGKGFDPICNNAAETFLENFESGNTELVSHFAAARGFLSGYKNLPSLASQSPCTAAAKAYAAAIKNSPSAPRQKALIAFIDEAVLSNDDGLDPVCGASAEAYFDAYQAGAGEAAASEAAAVAYLNAVEANPQFNLESPCGRAAQAYIASF